MDNADSPVEKELIKVKEMQLSSDDSGLMMKGEEEGLDALKSKNDAYELLSLVKSIKMKTKQVKEALVLNRVVQSTHLNAGREI